MRPGESLGDYQLLTLLGAGGMGEVWAAHQQTLGRRVALKLLPEAVTRRRLAMALCVLSFCFINFFLSIIPRGKNLIFYTLRAQCIEPLLIDDHPMGNLLPVM